MMADVGWGTKVLDVPAVFMVMELTVIEVAVAASTEEVDP